MDSENIGNDSELDISYIDEYGYEEEGSIHNTISTICSETEENSTILDENNSALRDATPEDDNLGQDISENTSKKTSDIWKYFDITEQNQICKYCKKTYAKRTSTSVLWHHFIKVK